MRFRSWSIFRSLFLLVLLLPLLPSAAPTASAGESLTVVGEVIDLACFIGHDGRGAGHKKCAQQCAKQGQPIGLVTAEGKVYLLVADHNDLTPYQKARDLAGEQVIIEGENASRDGVNALTVNSARKK